ncbi:O-antigen ligase family protein [Daejeonella sp.]|uniref:O-antigen ligase family protein n=1 Tax=Daejeonella sp. TaxID=2805397 RepID=UPI0030C63396
MFLLITILGVILFLNGNKFLGLTVFLFLLTDGFQLVPEPIMLFGLNIYGKDYALIFSLSILLSYLITQQIVFPYKSIVFVALVVFIIFLFIAAVVDLSAFNPSLAGFLLIFRVNLFLLTYFWLAKVDKPLFERLFKFVLIITVVQSVLCLMQIPTGIRLLTNGGISNFDELGFHWIRYTNIPYFILPCLFILLMNRQLKIPNKNLITILFLITLLFTLTRTLILGLIITVVVSVFLGLFKTQKKVVFWIGVMFILTLPVIGARLMTSGEDVAAAAAAETVEQGSNMTFAYRIFHMTERYLYISAETKMKLFGVGFIHERDFPKETFLLGHKDKNNLSTQLEQDDISWSNLFLRYGILGTSLYLLVYFAFCIWFFKNRSFSVGSAALMFLIMSLVLTFASGRFSQADFFLLPMFFYFYIRQIHVSQP